MTIGDKKSFLPVFVGSTYTDLKNYRRAVIEALTQLEAIVRGMEYFGSKPGSPLEECLNVVRSCDIYIGIFAMRYGSIPEGHKKSMTHLEYEEAQSLDLPSLIYIVDEENQPLLPKNVETGPGASRLKNFKEILTKKHMISLFTSPEDLRSKILNDLPALLKKIGTEVINDFTPEKSENDDEILKRFKLLPKMYSGKEVTIEFKNKGNYQSVYPEDCIALGLETGASVSSTVIVNSGNQFRIIGEREIAVALSELKKDVNVKANAITAFGTYDRIDWTDDGPRSTPEMEIGLKIKKIL